MRAAVLEDCGRIRVTEVARPLLGPGDHLVEMHAVGICGSDMHAFRGHHPFRTPPVVLGHEGAGRVAEVPEGSRFRRGDRVAIMPVLSCWQCNRCEIGLPHLCEHKRVPGSGWEGMLGEYVPAPGRVLFPLAEDVGYDEGAVMEPVAVAWHTARTGGVAAGQSVAVLGAGSIGGLVAAVCRLHQVATLLVSDVRTHNLEIVEKLTACYPVNAADTDVVEAGRRLTGGNGYDVVVIASGHPTCMDEALALSRPRGTVVVLPMFAGPVEVNFNPVVLNEVILRGSTIYTPADFRSAVDVVNSRRLDVRPYLGTTLPLAQTQEAFERLDDGVEVIKIQIDPSR